MTAAILSRNEFNNIVTFLLNRNVKINNKLPKYGFNTHIKSHVINVHFPYTKFINNKNLCDICFLWGNCINQSNIDSLQAALNTNSKLVLCEDGFIRSYDTWCNTQIEPRYVMSCSTIFDTSAYYFDSTKVSDIERMLNDASFNLSDYQLEFARHMIDKIVKNKISKYNHQPDFIPKIGRVGKKKILVVDQSYGDFSIKLGGADDNTFKLMLDSAIKENPDCDILVKTHPDTMTGNRSGYYVNLKEKDNIYKITYPINPFSLLSIVDKVYVCTTQFGFEALMANKEVHVFGLPFYANWGITIDNKKLERRKNKRSLEEIFYIFYCIYTKWFNPDINQICSLDNAIDWMINLKKEYKLKH